MSIYSDTMDRLMEHNAAIYAAQQKASQMTTGLTLREKVLASVGEHDSQAAPYIIDDIADLLSATGAPAYIRVADDLRGVVREEGE